MFFARTCDAMRRGSRCLRKPVSGDDAGRQHGAEYGQIGASLLEFGVAVIVVGFLAAALLERVLTAEEYAEKSAMELTIAHMRAGLRAQVGALLIADRAEEIAGLAGGNPTDWLDKPPGNYLGEYEGTPRGNEEGAWYFDVNSRELVYTANSQRHFVASAEHGHRVRLRIQPVAQPGSSAGRREPGWVELAIVNKYRWF